MRKDLPVYLFSGSEDPVGQQLEGVQLLMERYRQAGLRNICHDFYPGGRHEMLNEINRREVQTYCLDGSLPRWKDSIHRNSRSHFGAELTTRCPKAMLP